jgi:GMP synthase (glutamine-hydrolysing)
MDKKRKSHRVATSDDIEVSTYLEIARELQGEQLTSEVETISPGAREAIAVIDFGSQYSHLIARRVRECHVYCELFPFDEPWEKIASFRPKGFILSGGPAGVYESKAPLASPQLYASRLPILGICYGTQAIVHQMGGQVAPSDKREYGQAILNISDKESPLLADLPAFMPVWMSHGDQIVEIPTGFKSLAYTENSPNAVIGSGANIFGLQFHPEVVHTPNGKTIIQNFLYQVCGCHGIWTPANFISESISAIKQQVGNQLTCIFVNNGLLRREEPERALNTFRNNLKMNVVYVDAPGRFLRRLKGVTDPEIKRRRIGGEFIKIFEYKAGKLGKIDFLAQGTLYPDVIESTSKETKAAARIKTHHNVGGLPAKMSLTLIEPLRYLFKDEVREVGLALGLPEDMIWRQPFPGPGLAIRIIGEVTRERLELLRAADWILMSEIKQANLYRQLWQSFAVLTDVRSVGVMGDYRTYGYLVAVRAVTSQDAMTADWARLPYDLLARISSRIVNEVSGVNRVVYDITSKPPSTIEWE